VEIEAAGRALLDDVRVTPIFRVENILHRIDKAVDRRRREPHPALTVEERNKWVDYSFFDTIAGSGRRIPNC
jgi:hypothetical protein